VTRPAKPTNLSIRAGGVKIFSNPGIRGEPQHTGLEKEADGGPCPKNTASQREIADQIAQHLRSLYEDVLKQPVPGRFHELLRQLESAAPRPNKDGM
jgi:hypothetical protein